MQTFFRCKVSGILILPGILMQHSFFYSKRLWDFFATGILMHNLLWEFMRITNLDPKACFP